MKGLKGKSVLVTGASSGIGQAIAIRFAQEGANVAINYYSDQDEAIDTKEDIDQACRSIEGCGVSSLVVQADVSQEEDVDRMFTTAVDKFGGLDILINNAGMQISGPSHEIAIDKVDRMIAINLRGAYLCARKAIQHFLSQQKAGIILN
ncbi:SDR family NAD(P)-dependent oxidoreductase, partial [Leptolyngbya cf. ectocarpi LEGE 11479]